MKNRRSATPHDIMRLDTESQETKADIALVTYRQPLYAPKLQLPQSGVTRTDSAFEKFNDDNPEVYHALVMMARSLLARGYTQYSCRCLMEVLRYDMATRTHDPSGFKLPNNYSSRYARLIMQTCPDLQDFFELRELRS